MRVISVTFPPRGTTVRSGRVSGGDLLTLSPRRRDGDSSSRRRSCLTSAECSLFTSDFPPLHLTFPARQTARRPQSPGVLRLPGNSRSSELHTHCARSAGSYRCGQLGGAEARGKSRSTGGRRSVQLASSIFSRLPQVQRTRMFALG